MNIIPEPQELTCFGWNQYLLSDQAELYMPASDSRLLKAAADIFCGITTRKASDCFYVLCSGSTVPQAPFDLTSPLPDSYQLEITENGLCLVSLTAAGLFYGIHTLKQLTEDQGSHLPRLRIRDWAFTAMRCDHFDLRTIHPTFPHMLEYIREMAHYKINALLIEYEDKLPFPVMKELRHPHSLTKEQLKQLLDTAYENFIEVIPLQQTYGHLEYALKIPAYRPLREQENSVAELCPLKPGSYELVCGLIRDMASLHPNSHYLHLGGDEVWNIGCCEKCRSSGLSNTMLFIRFLNRLAAYAIQLGKKPIIWHDMLKDAASEELAQLDKRITIAVWIYSGRQMEQRALKLVQRFQAAGFSVLGAPSVRCWDESAGQNYPVADRRLENISTWIKIASDAPLDGLIFTNWSASLALGNPYGLFESTRYLTFFACEQSWNPKADRSTYPIRFFRLFHGIADQDFLKQDYTLTDYYQIPDIYRPLCCQNELTARLLEIMRQYEVPTKSGLPLQDLLFQGICYPDNEAVLTFLKEKYRENYSIYDQLRPSMQKLFEELLPPHMAGIYLSSRFYLPDIYRKNAEALFTGTSCRNDE